MHVGERSAALPRPHGLRARSAPRQGRGERESRPHNTQHSAESITVGSSHRISPSLALANAHLNVLLGPLTEIVDVGLTNDHEVVRNLCHAPFVLPDRSTFCHDVAPARRVGDERARSRRVPNHCVERKLCELKLLERAPVMREVSARLLFEDEGPEWVPLSGGHVGEALVGAPERVFCRLGRGGLSGLRRGCTLRLSQPRHRLLTRGLVIVHRYGPGVLAAAPEQCADGKRRDRSPHASPPPPAAGFFAPGAVPAGAVPAGVVFSGLGAGAVSRKRKVVAFPETNSSVSFVVSRSTFIFRSLTFTIRGRREI